MELDLAVKIKPSTNEDSIIEVPNSNSHVSESIKVKFGVDDLNVVAALLVAVDEDRFKALEIGGILHSENILACVATVVHELLLSGFDVSVGGIRHPVLSGFVSPGIDRIVSSAVEAVFEMYESGESMRVGISFVSTDLFFSLTAPSISYRLVSAALVLLRAFPSIFQGPFRDIVQEEILASEVLNPAEGKCTWLEEASSLDEYIDFRDLFLPPHEAVVLGGSGREPYGDIGELSCGI